MVTRVTGLKSRAAGWAGTGEHTAYRLQPPYMMCLDISRYLHCRARYLDIYAGNMHWPGHLPYTWARKWSMCHGTVSTVCSNDTTWAKNYVSLWSFADIYYLCQKTQVLEKVIPLLHRDCQKILESWWMGVEIFPWCMITSYLGTFFRIW